MVSGRYFAIMFYWIQSIDRRLSVSPTAFVHKVSSRRRHSPRDDTWSCATNNKKYSSNCPTLPTLVYIRRKTCKCRLLCKSRAKQDGLLGIIAAHARDFRGGGGERGDGASPLEWAEPLP